MTLRYVNALLIFLVVLDITLFSFCLFAPHYWFLIFHHADYVDPQALLKRTGGVWIGFTLMQAYALLKWKEQPHLLVMIAGVRLTEMVSDWIYLASAASHTWFASLGLTIAPIANIIFAWYFLRCYESIMASRVPRA